MDNVTLYFADIGTAIPAPLIRTFETTIVAGVTGLLICDARGEEHFTTSWTYEQLFGLLGTAKEVTQE